MSFLSKLFLKKGERVKVTDYRKGDKKTQNMTVVKCGLNQEDAVAESKRLREKSGKSHRIKPGEGGYCVLEGKTLPKPKGKSKGKGSAKSDSSKGGRCSTPMQRTIRKVDMTRSRSSYAGKESAEAARGRLKEANPKVKTSIQVSNCDPTRYYVYSA